MSAGGGGNGSSRDEEWSLKDLDGFALLLIFILLSPIWMPLLFGAVYGPLLTNQTNVRLLNQTLYNFTEYMCSQATHQVCTQATLDQFLNNLFIIEVLLLALVFVIIIVLALRNDDS